MAGITTGKTIQTFTFVCPDCKIAVTCGSAKERTFKRKLHLRIKHPEVDVTVLKTSWASTGPLPVRLTAEDQHVKFSVFGETKFHGVHSK